MRSTKSVASLLLAAGLCISAVACGGDDAGDATTSPAATGEGSTASTVTGDTTSAQDTKITMALGWLPTAEYAEYIIADKLGFYADEGLDVTVQPGGPDINTSQLVDSGQAEFGSARVGTVLATNDAGGHIVAVDQTFVRPGFRLVSKAEDGIGGPDTWKGRTIGVFSGNQGLYATLAKHDLDPDKDVTLVQQGYDVSAFVNGDIDLVSAFTFSELAQIIASGYSLDELTLYDFTDDGTDLVEFVLYANADWLAANRDSAVKFVKATLRGRIYCRDHAEECVKTVVQGTPDLPEPMQRWEMNEVNKLIWPAPNGVGQIDADQFMRTAQILFDYDVIKRLPDAAEFFDASIAADALSQLGSEDTTGTTWVPLEIPASELQG